MSSIYLNSSANLLKWNNIALANLRKNYNIGSVTIFARFAKRWHNLINISLFQYFEYALESVFFNIWMSFICSVNNHNFLHSYTSKFNQCFCGEFFFIILIMNKLQLRVIRFWWKFMSKNIQGGQKSLK